MDIHENQVRELLPCRFEPEAGGNGSNTSDESNYGARDRFFFLFFFLGGGAIEGQTNYFWGGGGWVIKRQANFLFFGGGEAISRRTNYRLRGRGEGRHSWT